MKNLSEYDSQKVDPKTGKLSNATNAITSTNVRNRAKVDPVTGKPSNATNAISSSTFWSRTKVDPVTGKPSNALNAISRSTFVNKKKVDPETGKPSNATNAIAIATFRSRAKVDPVTGKPSNATNAIACTTFKKRAKAAATKEKIGQTDNSVDYLAIESRNNPNNSSSSPIGKKRKKLDEENPQHSTPAPKKAKKNDPTEKHGKVKITNKIASHADKMEIDISKESSYFQSKNINLTVHKQYNNLNASITHQHLSYLGAPKNNAQHTHHTWENLEENRIHQREFLSQPTRETWNRSDNSNLTNNSVSSFHPKYGFIYQSTSVQQNQNTSHEQTANSSYMSTTQISPQQEMQSSNQNHSEKMSIETITDEQALFSELDNFSDPIDQFIDTDSANIWGRRGSTFSTLPSFETQTNSEEKDDFPFQLDSNLTNSF